MNETASDPLLTEALAFVQDTYELVPCLQREYLASEMVFRPMPADMLRQLETSGDFTIPEAGVPVMLNLSSGNEEAGLLVWVHPQTGELWVLVPTGR